MKTLIELAELELTELEYAVKSKSDMEDYISQFEEHAAPHLIHIIKGLLKENKTLRAKQPITIKRRVAV